MNSRPVRDKFGNGGPVRRVTVLINDQVIGTYQTDMWTWEDVVEEFISKFSLEEADNDDDVEGTV